MHGLNGKLFDFHPCSYGREHAELTNSDMAAGFTSNEDVTEDMGRVLKTIQEMSLSCIARLASCNLWVELGRIL